MDITRLSGLDAIEVSADVIRIGALAKMSKVAADGVIGRKWRTPVVKHEPDS
ncbi:hypothetical protein [Mesorhizobium sp. M1396]|uniref:hypothetical protein n=1 Tax=Mesorhizobium sp. M1396 TaxID=2957095 RepID=UPI00333D687E